MFGCLGRGLGLEASCGFPAESGYSSRESLAVENCELRFVGGAYFAPILLGKPEVGFSARPSKAMSRPFLGAKTLVWGLGP